ncbi:hypothetical protein Tcan_01072, partial [Toxocara canis]
IIHRFQYWSGLELSEEERKTVYNELSSYAAGLFVLVLVFAVYNIFEIYITRRYQKNLETSDEFMAISQTDPSYHDASARVMLAGGPGIDKPLERPPPYNPNYAPAPAYKR